MKNNLENILLKMNYQHNNERINNYFVQNECVCVYAEPRRMSGKSN